MKLRERLKSPTVLTLQGFAAGAFLFFNLHPLSPAQTEIPVQTGAMEISVPA